MKPIEFKNQNIVFAKDQPEYQPLPALKLDGISGEVISCWHLSFKERIKILFTGNIWACLVTFKKPLTPMMLSVDREDFFVTPED